MDVRLPIFMSSIDSITAKLMDGGFLAGALVVPLLQKPQELRRLAGVFDRFRERVGSAVDVYVAEHPEDDDARIALAGFLQYNIVRPYIVLEKAARDVEAGKPFDVGVSAALTILYLIKQEEIAEMSKSP
ncbi:MAG: hypothetical protein ABIA93_02850 [Candidatus Woesearchaeota archaeon]